ncbi:endonuclease domain-containing protein [Novosphingobium piscinae]|uniref:endonuclease domain-containing protein n=1 Tax=Novosphingobium piscinae TaxID=1507448 RepID=UPI001FE89F3E|nr:endonuclease domain-containing protein [Novosphingobium piscinae]
MSSRETSARTNSPPLQGRGRGWGLSAARNADLASFAQDMRRNPTEPEKRLWHALSQSQLGGFKFRRQAVIGPFIADFLCPQKALVVEVDGETHDVDRDQPRDRALQRMGYAVVHVTNAEVMHNIDGVRAFILGTLEATPDRRASPHPNPSPEGEGLDRSALPSPSGEGLGVGALPAAQPRKNDI